MQYNIPTGVNKKMAKYLYGFNQFGLFEKPNDFTPDLPCDFWRDSDGDIQHNFDTSEFYDTPTDVYVNKDTGNDSTGDGSSGNPYKTISKAVDIVKVAGAGTYQIIVKSDTAFTRDENIGTLTFTTNQIVSIIPDNASDKIYMTSAQTGLSWSADENIWYASRTNTYGVFDLNDVDDYGNYVRYEWVDDVATCKTTANSWYTNGTLVYVNNNSESAPTDSDTWILITVDYTNVDLETGAKLYLKNIHSYFCPNLNPTQFTGVVSGGESVGTIIADGCHFNGGNQRGDLAGAGNALSIVDIRNTYLFDCYASNSKLDGFNYHYTGVDADKTKNCLVIEYNCIVYNVGYKSSNGSTNCSTIHDGANIIRFKTIGVGGTVTLADVGDSYSICIDCNMSGTTDDTNYYFATINNTGKAILINCNGDNTVDELNCEVDSYIIAFAGKIKSTGKEHIILR